MLWEDLAFLLSFTARADRASESVPDWSCLSFTLILLHTESDQRQILNKEDIWGPSFLSHSLSLKTLWALDWLISLSPVQWLYLMFFPLNSSFSPVIENIRHSQEDSLLICSCIKTSFVRHCLIDNFFLGKKILRGNYLIFFKESYL